MRKMNSNTPGAIFFDLDGTLVDTIGDIASAMNRVLRELGYPGHRDAAYRDFVGYGLRITAQKALPGDARDEETVLEAGERLIRYYAEHPVDTTVAYDGIFEMLSELTARGIPRVILSNKSHDLVELVVSEVLRGFTFDLVRGAGSDYPLKPDPASAVALAESLGIDPADILFVGDSEVDIRTAAAAGMIPAGVTWGFRAPGVILEAGAALMFQRPGDIVEYLNPKDT